MYKMPCRDSTFRFIASELMRAVVETLEDLRTEIMMINSPAMRAIYMNDNLCNHLIMELRALIANLEENQNWATLSLVETQLRDIARIRRQATSRYLRRR